MKKVIALLCALVFAVYLNTGLTPAFEDTSGASKPTNQINEGKAEHSFKQQFQKQVQHWITTLAKEPGFASWHEANWEKLPLGPGRHGWVILITSAITQHEIGYLIVNTTPDGELQLAEYGLGEFPLFSSATLIRANELVQLKLNIGEPIGDSTPLDANPIYRGGEFSPIKKSSDRPRDDILREAVPERLYFNAFQAIWRLDVEGDKVYFDGVTGEAFNLNEDIMQHMKEHSVVHSQLIKADSQLLVEKRFPLFDPYVVLNWLIDEPYEVAEFQDLVQALAEPPHEVTYTATIFADKIRVPLAVVGYHLWDETEPYIMIDQYSLRFIPFSVLLQQGLFYTRANDSTPFF